LAFEFQEPANQARYRQSARAKVFSSLQRRQICIKKKNNHRDYLSRSEVHNWMCLRVRDCISRHEPDIQSEFKFLTSSSRTRAQYQEMSQLNALYYDVCDGCSSDLPYLSLIQTAGHFIRFSVSVPAEHQSGTSST